MTYRQPQLISMPNPTIFAHSSALAFTGWNFERPGVVQRFCVACPTSGVRCRRMKSRVNIKFRLKETIYNLFNND